MNKTLRVLVIDDDEIDQIALKRHFKKNKSLMLKFANSKTIGSNEIKNGDFNLILLDHNLGDGTGLEILNETDKKVPIIYVTGQGNEEIAASAIKSGAKDYVVKDQDRNYLKTIKARMDVVLKAFENERLLEKQAEEIKEKKKLNELLNLILTHDLKNYFTPIIGFSKLGKNKAEDAKLKEWFSIINEYSNEALELIERTRKYMKLKEGLLENDFLELDLNEIMAEIQKKLELRLKESKIELIFPEKNGCKIKTNPLFIEVIENLIDNAIKYSPNGSKITVSCEFRMENVIISIKDEGIGIEDKYKESIFDKFIQVHDTGIKGTGLGLAICKEIMRLLNGKIWVEDNQPKGSIFYILLPLLP